MKAVLQSAKSIVYAVACVGLLLPTQTAHATVFGSGIFTFSIDGASVANGYYGDQTGNPVQAGVMQTGSVSVQGVTGNQGTTYISCYDSKQGLIFSYSTQVNAQVSVQWTPSAPGAVHSLYCSANYTGYYANGTVSTPNINIQVN